MTNGNENITVKAEKAMVSYFWKGLALFMLGVVCGFFIAPMKNGMTIASNNAISNNENNGSAISAEPEDKEEE
ncbi:MAG: hypothetical protein IJ806_00060 [Ruminococcus sp.]|nr:hypothetical protein [Ruminococcus sp.]